MQCMKFVLKFKRFLLKGAPVVGGRGGVGVVKSIKILMLHSAAYICGASRDEVTPGLA